MSTLKQGTQYQWSKEAIFSLSSDQFGKLYNGLTSIVSSPVFQEKIVEAHNTFAVVDLQKTMNEVLSTAVDAGLAVEIIEESKDFYDGEVSDVATEEVHTMD